MELKIKRNKLVEEVAETAIQGLLYEVSITPKPGLVDRNNNGAHSDMDFFTFMSSGAALGKHFYHMAEQGYGWKGSKEDLFLQLREIGKQAEQDMFQSTNNVNTHKGLIFSLGIICAATTYSVTNNKEKNIEDILELCGEMTRNTLEEELKIIKEKEIVTKGEKLYKEYGVRGIRGEVADGFPSICEVALPRLRELKGENQDVNNTYLQILMHLLSKVEDTNILARHNFETLRYAKQKARECLRLGGAFSIEGKKAIKQLDEEFIEHNISPGGCADLLAVTIMLDKLEVVLRQRK